jgi:hypothetical protein
MIILMAAALTAATAEPSSAAPATVHTQHQHGMPMDGATKGDTTNGAPPKKAMDCACCKDMAKGHGTMGDHSEHKASK